MLCRTFNFSSFWKKISNSPALCTWPAHKVISEWSIYDSNTFKWRKLEIRMASRPWECLLSSRKKRDTSKFERWDSWSSILIIMFHRKTDNNRTVTFTALSDLVGSYVCFVRLLLTHVMRQEVCNAQKFDQVLELIRSNSFDTLIWSHPTWPIMCALSAKGDEVIITKVATANQLCQMIQFAANTAIYPAKKTSSARKFLHLF